MFVLEEENPILYDRIQERNLARQYDLLINCIEIGTIQGVRAFDKYLLWSLNAAAVANISQFGGRFREEPVYLKEYTPPHFEKVPHLMDQFISRVQENWSYGANMYWPLTSCGDSTGYIHSSRETAGRQERLVTTPCA